MHARTATALLPHDHQVQRMLQAVLLLEQRLDAEPTLDELAAAAHCGLLFIDLCTGDVAHWLRVEGLVRELYDVAVLPNVTRPMAFGFKTDEIQRTIAIGELGAL